MYIFITLAVFPLVINFVSCESTKEPPKEISQKTTFKTLVKDITTPASINITKSSWSHTTSHVTKQPHGPGENSPRHKKFLNSPHGLTKITKTLSLGFDPYFKKEYFEPFERRPKPVMLIAFRKKGFVSRHVVKQYTDNKSSDIAELQSPFNEVGSFWQDDKGEEA